MSRSEIRSRVRKAKIVIVGYLLGTLITWSAVRLLPLGEKLYEPSPELGKRIHSYVPKADHSADFSRR
jgi:hypothetical protein